MTGANPDSGIQFRNFRLLQAQYHFDAQRVEPNQELTYEIGFGDDGEERDGGELVYTQQVNVDAFPAEAVLAEGEPRVPVMHLVVQLEANFLAAAVTSVPPADFLASHAPAIVLALTREVVYRFTSNSPPLRPVLLPPMNVTAFKQLPVREP